MVRTSSAFYSFARRVSPCVHPCGIPLLNCQWRNRPSSNAFAGPSCLCSCASTDTSCFATPSSRNWRPSRQTAPKVSRRCRLPQLALATILQASSGVSDDEVIEATTMDRRWQVVLDCLDSDMPPFSKATLVAFRQRLIAQQIDRRHLERTVAIAATSGAFGSRQLRAALDSSPLWGAGRVEDTYNLLGHALRKALGVIARQQGRGLTEMASEVGTALVTGSSVKAALDLDCDNPGARQQALTLML